MRLIFTVACLQAAVLSFSQTDVQKQFMYECINRDAKGNVVLPKTESFSSKEDLFKKAKIIPVYKIVLDKADKLKLIQNKNYYLVLYIGRLYYFLEDSDSRFLEGSPIIQDIVQFDQEKKEYYVVYFTDNFSFDNKYLNPLLTDKSISFIIERGQRFATMDYINLKYGSIKKYKELASLDELRQKFTLVQSNNIIKNDYKIYENNCPKDTTLVLQTLINQIRSSTTAFTKQQELQLLERVRHKIDPYLFVKKQVKAALVASKIHDSIIKKVFSGSRAEYQKTKKEYNKPEGLYEFTVYGISITNELLQILDDRQFTDYKRYIDTMYPAIVTLNNYNNNKYRYNYVKDILIRNAVIKKYGHKEFANYSQKIVAGCGCVSEQTVKENQDK